MEVEVLLWIILAISTILFFIVVHKPLKHFVYVFFIKNQYQKMGESSKIRLVHQLNDAVAILSAEKTGAIITIENNDLLTDMRTDGIIINANVSSSLIISLFHKTSPLHDGAIIIKNKKITYVATFYKITSKSIDNKYGARHRAAMGISEATDSLTIIVSEETGKVTIVQHGTFTEVPLKEFQEVLTRFLLKG